MRPTAGPIEASTPRMCFFTRKQGTTTAIMRRVLARRSGRSCERRLRADRARGLEVARPDRHERLNQARLLGVEAVLGELIAEGGDGKDRLLAVDDPEVHRHDP